MHMNIENEPSPGKKIGGWKYTTITQGRGTNELHMLQNAEG